MGGMLEGTEPLSLPEIDDSNPVLRTQNLVSRLFAVSACLQAMLVYVSILKLLTNYLSSARFYLISIFF